MDIQFFDGLGEEGVEALGFGELEGLDFLLNGVLHDETGDVDVLGLAHAMDPIGALVLGSGVPPGLKVEDVIGLGEVEPNSAGLEGHEQHHGVFTIVKTLEDLFALVHGFATVKTEGSDVVLAEASFDVF